MGGFFKKIGEGILYIILLPVFVLILVFFAIIGFFQVFIQMLVALVRFFQGRSLYDPFPEDIKAYNILKAQAEKGEIPPINQQHQNIGTVNIIHHYANTPGIENQPPVQGQIPAQGNPQQVTFNGDSNDLYSQLAGMQKAKPIDAEVKEESEDKK